MAVPCCKRVGNSMLCDLFVLGVSAHHCFSLSTCHMVHFSKNSAKQYENKLFVLDYEMW